jgi:hypothetical protein
MSVPSSALKRSQARKQHEKGNFLFNPENGGDMFLRNAD